MFKSLTADTSVSELTLYEIFVGLCGAAVIGILLWVVFYSNRYISNQKVARVKHRTPMTPDEFYDTFYAQTALPKDVVLQLLKEVANAIEIPATLLRPQDRFEVELRPVKGWEVGDGITDLTYWLEWREKKYAVTLDPAKIRTLDDYIKIVGPVESSLKSKS